MSSTRRIFVVFAGLLIASAPADSAPAATAAERIEQCSDAQACFELAELLDSNANPYNTHHRQIARAFERACKLGHPDGCDRLADKRFKGHGVRRNDGVARALLKRGFALAKSGCDKGEPAACTQLASRLAEENSKVAYHQLSSTEASARAIALLEAACAKDHVRACTSLRWPVQQAYLMAAKETAVEAAEARAFKLLSASCLSGSLEACDQLELGTLSSRASPEQMTTFRRVRSEGLTSACDKGDRVSCRRLIEDHSIRPDDATVLALNRRLCLADEPHHQSCTRWADGIDESAAEHAVALEAACRSGWYLACRRWRDTLPGGAKAPANQKKVAEVGAAAMRTAKEMCESDIHPDACDWLAEAHDRGFGTPVDRGAAFLAYWRGCELGDVQACREVFSRDPLRANAKVVELQQTCSSDVESCYALRHMCEKRLLPACRAVATAAWPATPEGTESRMPRETLWAFQWAASDIKRPRKTPSFKRARDWVGRWQDQPLGVQLEVHPDGRFRWVALDYADRGGKPCVVEGKLHTKKGQLRWWESSATKAYLERHKEQSHCWSQYYRANLPPLDVAATPLFRTPDQVALIFERNATFGFSDPGGDVWLRLARVGSAASAPKLDDGGRFRYSGQWLIKFEQWGELVVNGGTRRKTTYTLRWADGKKERGTATCTKKNVTFCTTYRFSRLRGRSEILRAWTETQGPIYFRRKMGKRSKGPSEVIIVRLGHI